MSVFGFTSTMMAGLYIVGELGGEQSISNYTVTFYGLGNALIFPLSKKLTDRFGKTRTLLASLVLFAVFTMGCGFSHHFPVLVILRFFQGAAAGTFFPAGFSLILASTPPEKKQKALATLALLTTITPVIGATYGGWLAYDYDWKWIFYTHIPVILTIFYCIWKHLGHEKEPITKANIDWVGYAFYVLSFSCIVTIIALGQQLDWFRSSLISSLTAIGIVGLLFFILWEWNHEDPFMDLKLFKNSAFALTIVSVGLLFSAYFGMIILLSLWLHFFANYTPIWIGILLIHMGFAGAFLFLLILKWIKKTSPYIPVLIALIFFAISCFYSTTFNAETNFGRIAFSRILAGFGLAFFLFPLFMISLESVSKEHEIQVLGIFQSARLFAGSIGCTAYTTLWYRRQIFYHDRLGSELTEFSSVSQEFFNKVNLFLHANGGMSNELLEQALERQSSALALEDCFYLMAWTMVSLLCVLLFYCWRKKKFTASS
jgi:MFS transporter, DHA2 family, multidrug resistance protein